MKDTDDKVRLHICFYGYVQGVGFRYRSQQLASLFGLTGWVRNVDDYVEMEIQGSKQDIEQLINKMKENSWIDIRQIKARQIPLKEEEDFRITW